MELLTVMFQMAVRFLFGDWHFNLADSIDGAVLFGVIMFVSVFFGGNTAFNNFHFSRDPEDGQP